MTLNLDLSPAAARSLSRFNDLVDDDSSYFGDATSLYGKLQRLSDEPEIEAVIASAWSELTLDTSVLGEGFVDLIDGRGHLIFVIAWEYRPNEVAYIHDIGWEPRTNNAGE